MGNCGQTNILDTQSSTWLMSAPALEAEPDLHVYWAPHAGHECHWREANVWAHIEVLQCVSCIIIHGRVLSSQAGHLQIQRALVIVSGNCESAFHQCIVFCGVTITFVSNACNTLKSLPWILVKEVLIVITEDESISCTVEYQGSPRCTKPPADSISCTSPWMKTQITMVR
jgi:hypothetical protein